MLQLPSHGSPRGEEPVVVGGLKRNAAVNTYEAPARARAVRAAGAGR